MKLFCYEAIYLWGCFRALKIQQLNTVVGGRRGGFWDCWVVLKVVGGWF